MTRDKVKRLHGVVEIGKIYFSVGVGRKLVLGLSDEKLVFSISEEFPLIRIKIHIVTPNLGSIGGGVTVPALYPNLNIVVLEGHQGETLSVILTEEERNHVVITTVVRLGVISGNGTRCLSGAVTKKGVVHTLNEERIELGDLLATDPKAKLGGAGGVIGIETGRVLLNTRNTTRLNPDIAHEITLRADRDGHLVGSPESADVIHALRLHGKIGIALVVLTKKADLGVTSDEYILSAHGHELN
jgi:hypothetical protein